MQNKAQFIVSLIKKKAKKMNKKSKNNQNFGFWDKLSMLLAFSQLLFSLYYVVRNWRKSNKN
ncbi:hypothetical protein GCM10025879_03100 [Leuconostoc litchii]|nr:hypothetical protein GCM10025879_03100 [Leuconostoc litchii]